jgi:hypothetical protein
MDQTESTVSNNTPVVVFTDPLLRNREITNYTIAVAW